MIINLSGGGGLPEYSRHISFLTTVQPTFDLDLGYMSYGEEVNMSDAFQIDYMSRIQEIRIRITGTNVENILLDATGWTVIRQVGNVLCRRNVASWTEAVQRIGQFHIYASDSVPADPINATIQVSAITDQSAEILADGTTSLFIFFGSLWLTMESNNRKWSDLDGELWYTLETSGKYW